MILYSGCLIPIKGYDKAWTYASKYILLVVQPLNQVSNNPLEVIKVQYSSFEYDLKHLSDKKAITSVKHCTKYPQGGTGTSVLAQINACQHQFLNTCMFNFQPEFQILQVMAFLAIHSER